MQNQEIRPRILVQLYKRYYQDGIPYGIDTKEIIEAAGIPSNYTNLAFTNVIHLVDSYMIHGEYVIGTRYPTEIYIKTYGIDTVERTDKEFAKLHDDIRVKILTKLYEYNFTNHEEDTVLVDVDFVKSLGLQESDANVVIGDINYLDDKVLIEGPRQLGIPYPYRIQITSNGIDAVENSMNQSLVSIAEVDKNEETRVHEIIDEQDQRTKIQKFRDFVGENAGWIELVANVFRASVWGG